MVGYLTAKYVFTQEVVKKDSILLKGLSFVRSQKTFYTLSILKLHPPNSLYICITSY